MRGNDKEEFREKWHRAVKLHPEKAENVFRATGSSMEGKNEREIEEEAWKIHQLLNDRTPTDEKGNPVLPKKLPE